MSTEEGIYQDSDRDSIPQHERVQENGNKRSLSASRRRVKDLE